MSEPTLFELAVGNPTAIGQLAEILAKMETVSGLLQRACETCERQSRELNGWRQAMTPSVN